jgi:hypothetical protein
VKKTILAVVVAFSAGAVFTYAYNWARPGHIGPCAAAQETPVAPQDGSYDGGPKEPDNADTPAAQPASDPVAAPQVSSQAPPAEAAHRDWYAVSAEDAGRCFKTEGPSSIIKQYEGGMTTPSIDETKDANGNLSKVVVSVENDDKISSTEYDYWTSMDGCMAEGANKVDNLAKKYE